MVLLMTLLEPGQLNTLFSGDAARFCLQLFNVCGTGKVG